MSGVVSLFAAQKNYVISKTAVVRHTETKSGNINPIIVYLI